jgi:hypothetical protein
MVLNNGDLKCMLGWSMVRRWSLDFNWSLGWRRQDLDRINRKFFICSGKGRCTFKEEHRTFIFYNLLCSTFYSLY